MMRIALISLLSLTGLGCTGGSGTPDAGPADAADGGDPGPYLEWVHRFDYNSAAPLELALISTSIQQGVEVREITYAGARGPVPATLVVPPGQGPHAAVIYLHWGMGDRSEFVAESVAMAQRGSFGLSIDAPWKRPGNPSLSPDEAGIQIVVDVRRGVDLLLSLPAVDPNRLGYVGHSFGASRGGVLAGVERRFRTLVLMCGYARPSAYDGANAPGEFMDGLHYVGHATPAALLFQFGRQDEYVSEAMALEFSDPASTPKSVEWYDAGHELNDDARTARARWIAQQLSTTAP